MNGLPNGELGSKIEQFAESGAGFQTETSSGGPVWLVTFVDLISLMLAFFVMMYSMSTLTAPSWEAFTAAMQKSKIENLEDTRAMPPTPITAEPELPGRGIDVSYLRRVLEAGLQREETLALTTISERDGRLILSLPGDLYFASGAAAIVPQGRVALFGLAEMLSTLDNRIDLVGHTDPVQPSRGRPLDSNWKLSLARAASVADGLAKSGYRKTTTIRAEAATQFHLVAPELPRAERYRRARRVDLVIYSEKDHR